MDVDYVGLDDNKQQTLLHGVSKQEERGYKRNLAAGASAVLLAALAVCAYVAAPSTNVAAPPPSQVLMSNQIAYYDDVTIPEGQAIKCGAFQAAVFRYTNGQRRWYPTAAIASSWDPNWGRFTVVDCTNIPRGPDMPMKPTLQEGQAIKCAATQAEVFRVVAGQRRWYPTPAIATSWDPNWGSFIITDCSTLPRGPDMLLNPRGLPDGQAIKCDASQAEVFRLVGGQRRWYPNPTIATSWDPNWGQFLVVDCTSLTRGPDMLRNPKGLPEGQAIKCDASQAEVFRLDCGQRRWYPNPTIAASWDPNWGQFVVVDCTGLPRGPDMLRHPRGLRDGQAIKCDANQAEVFRLVGTTRRWYPNPTIAASWDPNWGSFIVVDCTSLTRGPDMLRHPRGLPDGQAIKCDANQAEVFRLVGTTSRRWYPNPTIATSWDANWSQFIVVDCTSLTRGPDMLRHPRGLPDGQAIKCDASQPEVFRLVGTTSRRWYPNPTIAASWDANWAQFVVVDCTSLTRGPDMLFNPRALTPGQAIKCDASQPEVFRIVGAQRCWYPNPEIASSWDTNWAQFVIVDCTLIARGPDMLFNPRNLPDGQAIKCGATSTEVFRIENKQRRLYPRDVIAASWDPNWSKARVVDCSVLPLGPPMPFNQPSITEGQAVRCLDADDMVFHFCGDMIRWYPTTAIADSWNSEWRNAILIDCEKYELGPDMATRIEGNGGAGGAGYY